MVKRSRLHTLSRSAKKPRWLTDYWHENWWHKTLVVLMVAVSLAIGTMYGIAQWYIHSSTSQQQLGISFIPDYADSLGLNPQETLDALLGIGVKNLRLVSYWSDSERTEGQYDFTQLDWQFQKAEAAHAKVILTLGLRQPRWPECHMPDWTAGKPASQWQPQLLQYMEAVVQRYKNSPSLDKYQLENEYFLKGFGICTDFSRERLIREYNMVKKLDSMHPVIVGRSNNALGFPVGQPTPDMFSISIYKRVWDGNFSHRYLEYPQPGWFYGFIAGSQKLLLHRNMVAGELQAEAWPPNGKSITETSLAEQNKSLSPKRLEDRFGYGRATGMPEIYLWGAEYWYYRQQALHDPTLMDVARSEFRQQP